MFIALAQGYLVKCKIVFSPKGKTKIKERWNNGEYGYGFEQAIT